VGSDSKRRTFGKGVWAFSIRAEGTSVSFVSLETLNAERNVSALLRSGSVLFSGVIPVDHVPEGLHVFRATVLILK